MAGWLDNGDYGRELLLLKALQIHMHCQSLSSQTHKADKNWTQWKPRILKDGKPGVCPGLVGKSQQSSDLQPGEEFSAPLFLALLLGGSLSPYVPLPPCDEGLGNG